MVMKLVAISIYSQVLLTSLYFELQLSHAYNSAQKLFFLKKKSHDLSKIVSKCIVYMISLATPPKANMISPL